MKLYHYVARPNNVLTEGLLSFANNPNANLRYYYKRSGATTHADIVKWFESCFEGRSRAIRGFSETIKWTEKSLSLEKFVKEADMFTIDLDALERDGLLEAVYLSPSVVQKDEVLTSQKGIGHTDVDETLIKLSSKDEISLEPVDWNICNDELGWRFAFVPYYLIVVKGGVIPPQYLTLENNNRW